MAIRDSEINQGRQAAGIYNRAATDDDKRQTLLQIRRLHWQMIDDGKAAEAAVFTEDFKNFSNGVDLAAYPRPPGMIAPRPRLQLAAPPPKPPLNDAELGINSARCRWLKRNSSFSWNYNEGGNTYQTILMPLPDARIFHHFITRYCPNAALRLEKDYGSIIAHANELKDYLRTGVHYDPIRRRMIKATGEEAKTGGIEIGGSPPFRGQMADATPGERISLVRSIIAEYVEWVNDTSDSTERFMRGNRLRAFKKNIAQHYPDTSKHIKPSEWKFGDHGLNQARLEDYTVDKRLQGAKNIIQEIIDAVNDAPAEDREAVSRRLYSFRKSLNDTYPDIYKQIPADAWDITEWGIHQKTIRRAPQKKQLEVTRAIVATQVAAVKSARDETSKATEIGRLRDIKAHVAANYPDIFAQMDDEEWRYSRTKYTNLKDATPAERLIIARELIAEFKANIKESTDKEDGENEEDTLSRTQAVNQLKKFKSRLKKEYPKTLAKIPADEWQYSDWDAQSKALARADPAERLQITKAAIVEGIAAIRGATNEAARVAATQKLRAFKREIHRGYSDTFADIPAADWKFSDNGRVDIKMATQEQRVELVSARLVGMMQRIVASEADTPERKSAVQALQNYKSNISRNYPTVFAEISLDSWDYLAALRSNPKGGVVAESMRRSPSITQRVVDDADMLGDTSGQTPSAKVFPERAVARAEGHDPAANTQTNLTEKLQPSGSRTSTITQRPRK